MPTYQVTDKETGRKFKLTGDSPPTEQELAEIFANLPPKELEGFPGAGFIEPAMAMASGALGEMVGGAAGFGVAKGAVGVPEGEGARVSQAISEAMTYQPRTEKGKAGMQAAGEFVQPAVDILEGAEETLGDIGFDIAGPMGGAFGKTLPTAAIEALTLGAAKGAIQPLKAAGKGAAETAQAAGKALEPVISDVTRIFEYQSPTKQKIAELIEAGSTDLETAAFKLDKPKAARKPASSKLGEKLRLGEARTATDSAANAAIKQGFDPGVIAAIKGSSPADKAAFKKMTRIMQKGKKNARYAIEHRPSNVAGDTLMQRLRVVQKANSDAGRQLDRVAKGLKGKQVEFEPAIDEFMADLDGMGIKLGPDLKPNFSGSDIEGAIGPENVIKKVIERMNQKQPIDAFELHRLKKYIDEQVTFGKNAEGLAGKTERVLKKLRRNLDQQLDQTFPEYDKVNTQYSETIGALDAFQDVAGQKMNLTGPNADKATGTLMRRIMSNAQSRVRLLDSVNEIEAVANKFGGKLTGQDLIEGPVRKGMESDLLTQLLFVDELDSVFGPVARTSFQGQIDQAIKQGQNMSTMSQKTAVGATLDAIKMGYEKIRSIDEAGAFKAIRDLLDE